MTDIDVRDNHDALFRDSPRLLIAMTVGASCFLGALLSHSWSLEDGTRPTLWLPTGLAVGLALATTVEARSWAAAGGVIGSSAHRAFVVADDPLPLGLHIFATTLIVIASLAVASRLFSSASRLDRPGRTIWTIGLSLMVAGVGAAVQVPGHSKDRWTLWSDWTLAEGLGLFLVGSLGVLPRSSWLIDGRPADRRGVFGIAVLTTAATTIIGVEITLPLLFVAIATLVWWSIRLGPRFGIPMAALIAGYVCTRTAAEAGPFASEGQVQVFALQMFVATIIIGVAAVSGLSLDLDQRRWWVVSLIAAIPDQVTVSRNEPHRTDSSENDAFVDYFLQTIARVKQTRQLDPKREVTTVETDGHTRFYEDRSVGLSQRHELTLRRDITDSVELLATAQRRERLWKHVASSGYQGFAEVGADGHIREVSPGLARELEQSSEELVGLPLSKIVDTDALENFSGALQRVRLGDILRFEAPFRRRGTGEIRWALFSIEPHHEEDGTYAGFTVLTLDTTGFHQDDVGSHVGLRVKAEAQVVERRRIAAAIHHGAMQDLAAARIMIGSLNDDAPAARIEKIDATLASAIMSLRLDVIDLTDAALVDDVATSLRVLLDQDELVGSTNVSLSDAGLGPITDLTAQRLLAVTQEALFNALTHSQARQITVKLGVRNDGYWASISDDGVGFEYSRRVGRRGHLGLQTMMERANEAGGWCTTVTSPGAGTSVEVWIPLD